MDNLIKFRTGPARRQTGQQADPPVSRASPGQLIYQLECRLRAGELSDYHRNQLSRLGKPMKLDGAKVKELAEGSAQLLTDLESDPDVRWSPQMISARNNLIRTLHQVYEDVRTNERYKQLEAAMNATIKRLCTLVSDPSQVQGIFEEELEKRLTD